MTSCHRYYQQGHPDNWPWLVVKTTVCLGVVKTTSALLGAVGCFIVVKTTDWFLLTGVQAGAGPKNRKELYFFNVESMLYY